MVQHGAVSLIITIINAQTLDYCPVLLHFSIYVQLIVNFPQFHSFHIGIFAACLTASLQSTVPVSEHLHVFALLVVNNWSCATSSGNNNPSCQMKQHKSESEIRLDFQESCTTNRVVGRLFFCNPVKVPPLSARTVLQ